MEYGDNLMGDIYINYGIENKVKNKWKDIINISDDTLRNQEVLKLIELISKNSKENGFFDKDKDVTINALYGSSVRVCDDELYFEFFKTIKQFFMLREQGKHNLDDLNIIAFSVKTVVDDYFKNGVYDKDKRIDLTQSYWDPNTKSYYYPSIKALKGLGIAQCVERSVCAHNLFLLAGFKSSYVSSRICKFNGQRMSHAFCLVESKDDKKSFLFDLNLNMIKALEKNPTEDIMNKKSFGINGQYYVYFNEEEKDSQPGQ